MSAIGHAGVVYGPENEKKSFQADLDTAVLAEISRNRATHLYNFVHNQLTAYYGRTDFADPQKQTGWYRVNDFLKWLQQADGKTAETFFNYYRQSNKFAWVYLGARYIGSKYPELKADFSKLIVANSKFDFLDNHASILGPIGIYIGEKTFKETGNYNNPPTLINLGIHELTHLLPALSPYYPDDKAFSEMVTFYSIRTYALPVKAKDALSYSSGVRDFLVTYRYSPIFLENMANEYHAYVVGLLFNWSKEEVIRLEDKFPFASEGLLSTIIPYLFASENRFLDLDLIKTYDYQTFYKELAPRLKLSDSAAYDLEHKAQRDVVFLFNSDCQTLQKDFAYNCPNPARNYPVFLKAYQREPYFKLFAGIPPSAKRQIPKATPEIMAKMNRFFQDVAFYVPAKTKQAIFAKAPYLTPLSPAGIGPMAFKGHYAQISDAIYKALLRSGAKPLAVPPGYM